jgi:hypothetical protein
MRDVAPPASAVAAANATATEAAKPLVEKRSAVEERLAEVGAKEANLACAVASGASFEALKAALATEQANRHMLEKERDSLNREIEALSGDPIEPREGPKALERLPLALRGGHRRGAL